MSKTVLITGAGGGMGQAACRRLLEQGWTVFALDRQAPRSAENLCFVPTDLTDAASVEEAFAQVRQQTERLDAIVHLAGVYDLNSLVEMDEEAFTRLFQVNLFGVYRVNRTFFPLLGKGSRIVITSSELAPLDPLPFTGVYGISKAALERYADSLRMEVNLHGISVSVIRPGAVKTGLLDVSTRALDRFCSETKYYPCNAERFRRIVNGVEAKHVPPERIAGRVERALTAKRPKYTYNVNRNPLLRLLDLLPKRLQVAIIRGILKN